MVVFIKEVPKIPLLSMLLMKIMVAMGISLWIGNDISDL
jgi:hypothetical protein